MKIVHLISSLGSGGAEAILYEVTTRSAYPKNKHVVISLTDFGKYGPLLRKKGIEVHFLNIRKNFAFILKLLSLSRLIKITKPDVVQTWLYHSDLVGGIIAKLIGCKHIYWGIHNVELHPGKSKLNTIIIRKICAKLSKYIPHGIIYCSKFAARHHHKIGYYQKKTHIVHNGVDIHKFIPDNKTGLVLKKQLSLDSGIPIIGFVARFDPFKGHSILFDALKIIKNKGMQIKCILVGKDMIEENNKLKKILINKGINNDTLLLGQRSDISAVMNALDIHVLPSISESFGNVIVEAMSCGTPCITSKIGMPEYILGKTGWVVPPNDPESLAKVILKAIFEMKSSILWEKRKKACRQRVLDNFSSNVMVENYEKIWSRFIV